MAPDKRNVELRRIETLTANSVDLTSKLFRKKGIETVVFEADFLHDSALQLHKVVNSLGRRKWMSLLDLADVANQLELRVSQLHFLIEEPKGTTMVDIGAYFRELAESFQRAQS